MCERYIHQLLLTRPQLGTLPATQAGALTGNQTVDPSVLRMALNPLRATPARAPSKILLLDL